MKKFTSCDESEERLIRLAMVYGAAFVILSPEYRSDNFEEMVLNMHDHEGHLTVTFNASIAFKNEHVVMDCFENLWASIGKETAEEVRFKKDWSEQDAKIIKEAIFKL